MSEKELKSRITLEDSMTPSLNKIISSMNKIISTSSNFDRKINSIANSMNKTSKNTYQTVNQIKKTGDSFESLSKILGEIHGTLSTMGNDVGNISKKFNELDNSIKKATDSNKKLKDSNKKSSLTFSQLSTTISSMIYNTEKLYNVAKKFFEFADELSLINSRLRLISDDTDELIKKIANSATDSRSSFKTMADQVSQFGIIAGNAFKDTDDLVRFLNLMNKVFTISGSTQGMKDSAMYNMLQSFGSGTIEGQDWKYIVTNAAKIQEYMSKYTGKDVGTLRNDIGQRKIPSKTIKEALYANESEIENTFKKFPKTFESIFTSSTNNIMVKLMTLGNEINKMLNNEAFLSFFNVIGTVIGGIIDGATLVMKLLNVVGTFIEPIAPVFEALGYMLIPAVAVAIFGLFKALTLALIPAFMKLKTVSFIAGLSINWPFLLAIAAIGLVIFALKKLGYSFSDVIAGIVGGIAGVAGFAWDLVKVTLGGIVDAVTLAIDKMLDYIGAGLIKIGKFLHIDWIANAGNSLKNVKRTNFLGEMSSSRVDWAKSASGWTKSSLNKAGSFLDNFGGNSNKGFGLGNFGGDISTGLGLDDIADSDGVKVKGVKDTVNTKGEMKMSDEDIKLLHDIAKTEFINRYTTLRPIMQVQFGDVHETADVDGILDRVGELMDNALTESLG